MDIKKHQKKGYYMSSRIWKGRCEDCYDVKELRICNDDTVPLGMAAELCDDCIKQRKILHQQGDEPPHIGLLISGIWKDALPLVVMQGTNSIKVSVKFLSDGENRGIVRLRFDNKPKWLPGGVFGRTSTIALSEAKQFLEMFYFPTSTVGLA